MFKKKKNTAKYLLVNEDEMIRSDIIDGEVLSSNANKFFNYYNIPSEYRKFIIKFSYDYGYLKVFDFIGGISFDVVKNTRINRHSSLQLFKGVSCQASAFEHCDSSFEKLVIDSDFIDDDCMLSFIEKMEKDGVVEDYLKALKSFYSKTINKDIEGDKLLLKP